MYDETLGGYTTYDRAGGTVSTSLGVPGTTRVVAYDGSVAAEYARRYGYDLELLTVETPLIESAKSVNGVIELTWTDVPKVNTYQLYVKTGSGGWETIAQPNGPAYTWDGAQPGTTYTFTVQCLGQDRHTPVSSWDMDGKSVTTPASGAGALPAAPKLKGASSAVGGVHVTWSKVSGAVRYRVYYKTGKVGWTKAGETTGTSYTWTKAKSGTKYSFTVRCVNAKGTAFTYK